MLLSKLPLTLLLLSLHYGRAQDPLMSAQQGLAAGAEAVIEHQQANPDERVIGVILEKEQPEGQANDNGDNDNAHHDIPRMNVAASQGAQQHAHEREQEAKQHAQQHQQNTHGHEHDQQQQQERQHHRHLHRHHEKDAHSNDHAEQGHPSSRDDSGSSANHNDQQAAHGSTHNDQSNKNQDHGSSAKSQEGSSGRQAKESTGHSTSGNTHKRSDENAGGSSDQEEVTAQEDVSVRKDIDQTKYYDNDGDFVTSWNDLPNIVELTDENFEHETQATTGSTTGAWLFSYNFPPAKPIQVQGQLPEPSYWYDRNIVLANLKPPSPVTLKRLGLSKSHTQSGNGLVFLQPQGTFHVLPNKEGTNLHWSDILHFCAHPSTTTSTNNESGSTNARGNKIAPMPSFLGHFKEMFHKFTSGKQGKSFFPMLTSALALLTAIGVYKSMTGGNKSHKTSNRGTNETKNRGTSETNKKATKVVKTREGTGNTNPNEAHTVNKGKAQVETKPRDTRIVETRVAKIEDDLNNPDSNVTDVYVAENQRMK